MINNVIVFSGDIALKNEKPLKYSDKISSFPKNEPKNTPKISLEIPKRTPTPPNFKLNFFSEVHTSALQAQFRKRFHPEY